MSTLHHIIDLRVDDAEESVKRESNESSDTISAGAASDLAGLQFFEVVRTTPGRNESTSKTGDTRDDALLEQFVPTRESRRASQLSEDLENSDIESSQTKLSATLAQECSTSAQILEALDKTLTVPIDFAAKVTSRTETSSQSRGSGGSDTPTSNASYIPCWSNRHELAQDSPLEPASDIYTPPSNSTVSNEPEPLTHQEPTDFTQLQLLLTTNLAQIESILVNTSQSGLNILLML